LGNRDIQGFVEEKILIGMMLILEKLMVGGFGSSVASELNYGSLLLKGN
jgi:hypothetical protein